MEPIQIGVIIAIIFLIIIVVVTMTPSKEDANFYYFPNTDMNGGDLKPLWGRKLPNVEAAKMLCMSMPECKGFGYLEADGLYWFKDNLVTPSTHTGFHMFVKK